MSLHKAENATIGDAVTTFMYASAVNVVLAHGVVVEQLAAAWVALAFILFLAIDWLSRVRVPIGFPPEDQEIRRRVGTQLAKGVTEIACVFVLVLAAISRFSPDFANRGHGRWQLLILCFFLASFFWNLIALRVMQKVSWWALFRAALSGSVFDLQEIRPYTERFWKPFDKAIGELSVQLTEVEALDRYDGVKRACVQLAIGRALTQLLALHVTLANAVVAVLLAMGRADLFVVRHLIETTGAAPAIIQVGLGVLVVALPAWIFNMVSPDLWKAQLAGKELGSLVVCLRVAGGIMSLLLLLVFYLSFSLEGIVWALLAQHAAFGLFMQFIGPVPDSTPPRLRATCPGRLRGAP